MKLGMLSLGGALVAAALCLFPHARAHAADEDDCFHPASHDPLPIFHMGETGIANPTIVPIYYSQDPVAPQMVEYYSKLGASSYFSTQLAEYGLNHVTIAPALTIDGSLPASATDLDIFLYLDGLSSTGRLPAHDDSTIFVVRFPSGVAAVTGVLDYYGVPLCGAAAQNEYFSDGSTLNMAFAASCGPAQTGPAALDAATIGFAAAASLGIISPLSSATPGAFDLSWSGSAWAWTSGGTTNHAMLCQTAAPDGIYTPADLGAAVPHIWSNAAAAAGTNPCAAGTSPAVPYFNAAPRIRGGTVVQPDLIAKGLIIPPGESKTVPVDLFSELPTPAFDLEAIERADLSSSPIHALTFAWDCAHGSNGDVRHLTIARSSDPGAAAAGARVVEIRASLGATTRSWFIVVGLN